MSGVMSPQDANQVLKIAHDIPSDSLKVKLVGGEISISATDDSIRIGDGVDLVTTTTVGADVGLDVNVIGGNVVVNGLKSGLKTSVITVSDVATPIPAVALVNRNSLSIRVWGPNRVFFGDATVTATTGYPKLQFEEIHLDIQDDAAVEMYAICSAGQTCEIRIMEIA